MRARIGSVLSSPKLVNGGSPQGSILGNLLFTITTDYLTESIEYNKVNKNEAILQPSTQDNSHSSGSVLVIDGSLARIAQESGSVLGIDNISVEQEESDGTINFDDNGISPSLDGTPEPSYKIHPDYTQSTPTARGQFERFIPLGNLVNACLSGDYSNTTGLTFCLHEQP